MNDREGHVQGLDRTRTPPTLSMLEEFLDDGLLLLARAVRDYADKQDVVLIPSAALTLRKLCHEMKSQVPLLGLLERQGHSVPEFIDGSDGTVGFSIELGLDQNLRTIGVRLIAPFDAVSRRLHWRDWWQASALCLPVDAGTGWQGGRIPVSRESLAVEWANRYGGAHVDVRGAEQWLIDLTEMRQLGFWADTTDETGSPGAALKWFDEPHPGGNWHPLRIRTRALAHLVLLRIAAEFIASYGREVPDSFTAASDDPDLQGAKRIVRLTG